MDYHDAERRQVDAYSEGSEIPWTVSLGTFMLLLITLLDPIGIARVLANTKQVLSDIKEHAGPPTHGDYIDAYAVIAIMMAGILIFARFYLRLVLSVYRGNSRTRTGIVAFYIAMAPALVILALNDHHPDDHPAALFFFVPFYAVVIALLCSPSANSYFQAKRVHESDT